MVVRSPCPSYAVTAPHIWKCLLDQTGERLPAAAGQRRLLAILTVVAASGEQGISRDKLLALLWSEGEPDKSRHALTQSLYHIRKALGVERVFLHGRDLRLDSSVINSDVGDFLQAVRAGRLEEAVAHYSGPFVDGFYLNGDPEFEFWVSSMRSRFARHYRDALVALAKEAKGNGGAAAELRWSEQLAAHDPLDGSAIARLISCLVATGDRAGALQCAHSYEERMRNELDLPPDEAVVDLVAQLRRTSPSPAQGDPVAAAEFASTLALDPEPASIPVAPFRVDKSDPLSADLRDGLLDLLTARLVGADSKRAADPARVLQAWTAAGNASDTPISVSAASQVAHDLGAGEALIGSLESSGPTVVIDASLVDVGRTAITRTRSLPSPPWDSPRPPTERMPPSNTIEAWRSHGSERTNRHRPTAHISLPSRDRDTPSRRRLQMRWLRGSKLFVWHLTARMAGMSWERASTTMAISSEWLTHRRARQKFRHALQLDPSFAPARRMLTLLLARQGDTAALRRVVDTVGDADSVDAMRVFVKWRSAQALRDARALARVRREFEDAPNSALRAIAMTGQFDGASIDDGDRAIAILRRRALSGAELLDIELARHSRALNSDDFAGALATTALVGMAQPSLHPQLRLRVLDALYSSGDRTAARLGIRRTRWPRCNAVRTCAAGRATGRPVFVC